MPARASIPMEAHIFQWFSSKVLVNLIQHKLISTRAHAFHSPANVRGYQDARCLQGRTGQPCYD